MQGNQPLQIVCQVGTMLRKAFRKGVPGQVVRVRQMVHPRKALPPAAIVDDTANRNPAKAGTVIAALAPDQSGARALAACALCCQRYFERRIDRLAARVGKKDSIQPLGHQIGNAAGQFKGEGVAKLKCRAEIHRCRGF